MLALAIAGGAALLPLASTAASWSFLNRTIAARIPAKELPAFRAAVAQVLNATPDRQPSQWESRRGRPGAPVSVRLVPEQTVETASAGKCRLLVADVSQSGASETWRYWFCQQADGAWKASGNDLP